MIAITGSRRLHGHAQRTLQTEKQPDERNQVLTFLFIYITTRCPLTHWKDVIATQDVSSFVMSILA